MLRSYRVVYENCIGQCATYFGLCETRAKTKRGILRAIARDFVAHFYTDTFKLLSYQTANDEWVELCDAAPDDDYYTWLYAHKYVLDAR